MHEILHKITAISKQAYNYINSAYSKLCAYGANYAILRLIRIDRPAAIVLLVSPIMWLLLLDRSNNACSVVKSFCFFLFAAIIMRSVGCIINDLVDSKIDAQVLRTADRPIASGEIKPMTAIMFAGVLLLIAFCLLMTLSSTAVIISLCTGVSIVIYPFMKRYTYYAQVVLGVVFNMGVWIAWYDKHSYFSVVPLFVYVSSVFWTIAFDTLYAYQDVEDDRQLGIKSIAVLIGDKQKIASKVIQNLYKVMIIGIWMVGYIVRLNTLFHALMLLISYFVYIAVDQFDIKDERGCRRMFEMNAPLALLIILTILLGKL